MGRKANLCRLQNSDKGLKEDVNLNKNNKEQVTRITKWKRSIKRTMNSSTMESKITMMIESLAD